MPCRGRFQITVLKLERHEEPGSSGRATPLLDNEANVVTSQAVVDAIAGRLERAYRLRRPGWTGFCTTPRVWSAAAERLFDAHEADRSLPLDPELYVAVQPTLPAFPNPWEELARADSVDRYRVQVAAIVAALRDELTGEI